jgi:hypothetical protein
MVFAKGGLRRKAPWFSAGTVQRRSRVLWSRMEERTLTAEALSAVRLIAGSPLALFGVFALLVFVLA